jgi:DNA-binding MarR family transcriptional regulator
MGEHHWKGNRRYAKADVYALADLIREYQLSFAVACLYRTLCEQCDYRNLVYGGSVTELHELTGLSRKTVTKYLDELCDKKLITRLPTPVGSRQTLYDVSTAYSKLIVPNEETPRARAKKAAKEQQMETDSAPGASSTRQMTHSTRENTTFGGREASRREESEATSDSNQSLQEEEWSSDPGQLFDQVTQRYTQGFARQQLEGELRKLGLEPDDDWRAASFSKGLDQQIVEAFMSVVHEFRDF